MRRCVVYIHVTDTALTFDLKVKCIGFFSLLRAWATTFLSVDIIIIWHMSISPWDDVSHAFITKVKSLP